ncbi:hemolysin family protein [Bulleidia sp. HCP3S3_F2]|jgi:putative hemolysin|uniref:hemolysin family protein n=1 Tax=unclassified Bulleidia TaxID=2704656 RepID=UPI002A8F5FFE|nr:hemolysin family protein [Erysipelotrichaceae bacterium]MDD7057936.1 hemolysin family protein [Erysipelotrichaceae bacterium]MDY3660661.1 hemolysin family protein [Bulleidia sp.]
MSTYIIAIVILTLFSGLFSATETAYSSSSKIRLKNMANDGKTKASSVLVILDDFDKFLTSVLIGNNIVNIASATISTLLFSLILKGGKGPTVSTIVITVITLLFGEIAPKSLAKQAPEKFACATVGVVNFFEFVFTPLTIVLKGWTWLVNHFAHIEQDEGDISDELITMVDEAEKDGNLEEHESDLISAAIEFNDLDVKDVLTPRVDIVAVNIASSHEQIEKAFRFNSFSRLPVYENTVDNIVGVIHEKDFYELMYHNNKGPIRRIIKPVIYTSPNTQISTCMKQLQAAKLHMAVVLDEYGGTEGIITLEDIIEELVGEIWDEHDVVEDFYTKVDDYTWMVKGDAEIDDLIDRFGVEEEDEEFDFITVSGWAIAELHHIPKVNEEFDYKNLHVTITKADQRKVLEVKVEIQKEEEDKEND